MALLTLIFVSLTASLYATEIEVNTTADRIEDDGLCTLREAVIAANNDHPSGERGGECEGGSGDDRIHLPEGRYRLTVTGRNEDDSRTGDLDLRSNMKIVGISPVRTIIHGIGNDRIFDTGPYLITLSSLTLTGGDPGEGETGGGIYNAGGWLTIIDCWILENWASSGGGLINHSEGHLLVSRSKIVRNTAQGGDGGGLSNTEGEVIVEGSTIGQNMAEGIGGGILNFSFCPPCRVVVRNSTIVGNEAHFGAAIANAGTIVIHNTTLARNVAAVDGGGLYQMADFAELLHVTAAHNRAGGNGGGLFYGGGDGTLLLQNTLLASNSAGEEGNDCYGEINLEGRNLIEDTNGCEIDLNIDDLLDLSAGLSNYREGPGAGSGHFPLLSTSPAIDGADPSLCVGPNAWDQLGRARDLHCDMGSIEKMRIQPRSLGIPLPQVSPHTPRYQLPRSATHAL